MHGNAKEQVSNSGPYKQTQKKRSKTCEDNYIYLISQMCNQLNMIAHYNRYLFTKCCGMKEKSLIFAFKVYRNFSKNLKMKCTEV